MGRTKRKIKWKIEAVVIVGALFLLSTGLVYAAVTSTTNFDIGLRVFRPIRVMVQWAVPEGRVGAPGTNWDNYFYLTVKSPDGVSLLDYMPNVATATEAGTYLVTTTLRNLDGTGNYDVGIKGWQHITRKLDNVYLNDGLLINMLNFSQADNSAPTGTVVLLAGDISGAGNSTTTMGDDVINAVDLSLLIERIDDDDPTGNVIRANLNQDIVVNSVDLSLLLKNLDAEGDK